MKSSKYKVQSTKRERTKSFSPRLKVMLKICKNVSLCTLTERKRQHCGHNEAELHKKCLFHSVRANWHRANCHRANWLWDETRKYHDYADFILQHITDKLYNKARNLSSMKYIPVVRYEVNRDNSMSNKIWSVYSVYVCRNLNLPKLMARLRRVGRNRPSF